MEMETVFKMLNIKFIFTLLIAWEDFIAFLSYLLQAHQFDKYAKYSASPFISFLHKIHQFFKEEEGLTYFGEQKYSNGGQKTNWWAMN